MKNILLLFTFLIGISTYSFAQQTNAYWETVEEQAIVLAEKSTRYVVPRAYTTHQLHLNNLKKTLADAPREYTAQAKNAALKITFPMPNGNNRDFAIYESLVMHEDLAARYPMIKSYAGKSLTGHAVIRFDITTKGLHAIIFENGKYTYIDPYAYHQDEYYISYYATDFLDNEMRKQFTCEVSDEHMLDVEPMDHSLDHAHNHEAVPAQKSASEPVILRQYDIAIACTGEYTQFHGGTKEDGLSAITTAVNRLNMIFERDLAIRMVLVAHNDQVVYENGGNDPYTNGNNGLLNDENQTNLDIVIGYGQYDIGHVFSNGGFSGLASLAGVCRGSKAQASSTRFQPVNDPFLVAIVAHEMGHQLSANHSFNSCHNVNSGTGYEPGGGTTIMSYAGICGDPVNNIAQTSDPYYFTYSLQEIYNYMHTGAGNGCANRIETNNLLPEVTIPLENDFYIPISTAFEITANVSDENNDAITYCWEQLDLGPMAPPGTPEGDSPLFRSYPPTDNPDRVFPRMDLLLNNQYDRSEILPDYSRNMTFRCTARDNNVEAGGVAWEEVEFKATADAGPFLINYPSDSDDVWEVGQFVEVVWDVANTNGALVNCQAVNIMLSLDGGQNFDMPLVMDTPNDGSEFILVPDELSTTARIKIKAANNIFFDISNDNFSIIPPSVPGYSLGTSVSIQQVCLPEVVTVDIITSSLLGYDEVIDLSIISGLPDDAVINFSSDAIIPGESSQLSIDFTNVTTEDTYEIILQATAMNADTSYRSMFLTTVSNDFSSLQLQSPLDGVSGVSGLPDFEWTTAEAADFYNIQIATNPSFNAESIVDEAFNLTTTPYTPPILLDENTLYYWKITPINECGAGTPTIPMAFHTESLSCVPTAATDIPIFISTSGAPSIESKIAVNAEGTIKDINIPFLRGNHEWLSELTVSLISPAGTEVTLFNFLCSNFNGQFDMTFDDQAPNPLACPPSGTFRPASPLSTFLGESVNGIWTLKVQDNNGGSGGVLEDWALEFCTNISLNNPSLVLNEPLPVNTNGGRDISQDFLMVSDPDNDERDLIHTITALPQYGQLYLNGETIGVGGQYTQRDVHERNLRYEHDGSDNEEDHYIFTVIDGDGGWTGSHTFQIIIDDTMIVGTEDFATNASIEIFPNPASDYINVNIQQENKEAVQIQLLNIHGQILHTATANTNSNIRMATKHLASGIYFLKAQLGDKLLTRKLTIQ